MAPAPTLRGRVRTWEGCGADSANLGTALLLPCLGSRKLGLASVELTATRPNSPLPRLRRHAQWPSVARVPPRGPTDQMGNTPVWMGASALDKRAPHHRPLASAGHSCSVSPSCWAGVTGSDLQYRLKRQCTARLSICGSEGREGPGPPCGHSANRNAPAHSCSKSSMTSLGPS